MGFFWLLGVGCSIYFPCCWSWELLVCLAFCILGLNHTSPTYPSWWLFMESTPLRFSFSLVLPRALSWGPFFLIYVNDLSLCHFFSMDVRLSCMQMIPLFYKPISQSTDLSDFQSAINIIHTWFSSNHFTAVCCQNQIHGHFNQEGSIPWCFNAPQQSTDWAGFIS